MSTHRATLASSRFRSRHAIFAPTLHFLKATSCQRLVPGDQISVSRRVTVRVLARGSPQARPRLLASRCPQRQAFPLTKTPPPFPFTGLVGCDRRTPAGGHSFDGAPDEVQGRSLRERTRRPAITLSVAALSFKKKERARSPNLWCS